MNTDDLSAEERRLLIELAVWSRDFFDNREGQWGRDAAGVLCKLIPEASGECLCRTPLCGHPASQHTGPLGACTVCKKECWS